MSKGLEELKRMAYENACCRCQYCIDNKCTNKGECVWKTIEEELKELEECREMMKRFNEACVPMILDNETEKKLKVLEIIKNKKVDTHSLRRLNLEEYNYGVMLGKKNIPVYECELLTQDEFDLLKEALL